MYKTVLVCGGRDWPRTQEAHNFVMSALDRIFFSRGWYTEMDQYGNWLPTVKIIAGEAKGIDQEAIEYAIINWTDYQGFPADWKKYGRKAGPIRNQQMLDEGKPDLVIAFPGGKGTADMVRRAKKAGVEVIEIDR